MIQYIAMLLLPVFDRIRGDGKPPVPRPIIKTLMGAAVLAILLGTLDLPWQLLVIGVLGHMIGESFGWGVAIGAGLGKVTKKEWDVIKLGTPERKTEWYLKIPGVNHSWQTALLFRGTLWSLIPAVGLYLYIGPEAAAAITLSHALGMVLGIYAARIFEGMDNPVAAAVSKLSFTKFGAKDRWAMQEIYRGAVIAILLFFGSFFVTTQTIDMAVTPGEPAAVITPGGPVATVAPNEPSPAAPAVVIEERLITVDRVVPGPTITVTVPAECPSPVERTCTISSMTPEEAAEWSDS